MKDDRKTTGNVELTEEDILTYEISDEALEAAAGTERGGKWTTVAGTTVHASGCDCC